MIKNLFTLLAIISYEFSFLASLSLFGAMIGAFAIGAQCDYLGRRPALMIMQLVSVLGLLLLRFAYNVPMLYAGSLLGGYVQGAGNAVMPTYVGEINQPRIRKFTGSFIVLSFTIGFAITKLIGILVSWRTTTTIIAVLPCIIFILLFICPETPTWYMLKGKKETAIEVMMRLRGDTAVAMTEISRIQANLEKQKQINSESEDSSNIKNLISVISKGTFLRPCGVLVIIFAVCWQWTGGGPVTFYTEDILKQFEVPIPVSWIATGQGVIQFVFSLLGVFISSIIPRRKYYIGSAFFVFLGATILGASIHLLKYKFFLDFLEEYPAGRWISIVGFSLYIFGYQTGLISVCFMLLGELLPSNAKGIGAFIVIQLNNISFFVSVKSAKFNVETLGLDGFFWLCASVALFSIIFAYIFVPETFGRSLEDMEDHYRRICYPNKYKRDANTIKNIAEITNLAYVSE